MAQAPTKRDWATALRLLDEAQAAINSELNAAGWDEVRQQPGLMTKSRLTDRIAKFQGRVGRSAPLK